MGDSPPAAASWLRRRRRLLLPLLPDFVPGWALPSGDGGLCAGGLRPAARPPPPGAAAEKAQWLAGSGRSGQRVAGAGATSREQRRRPAQVRLGGGGERLRGRLACERASSRSGGQLGLVGLAVDDVTYLPELQGAEVQPGERLPPAVRWLAAERLPQCLHLCWVFLSPPPPPAPKSLSEKEGCNSRGRFTSWVGPDPLSQGG